MLNIGTNLDGVDHPRSSEFKIILVNVIGD